ncbi:MAG: class I SAM-dependent methyltransferase [Patescibacteria group bacterium]
MYLSPTLYNKLIRPKFLVKKYIKKIIQNQFDFTGSNVLDFGCGTGSACFIFSPKNYLGIDIDKKRIDFAKKSFPSYKFEVLNDNIIPAEDGIFDFICIFATIHHISDTVFKKYINEFKRVMKPSGAIIVIEPVISGKNKLNNWFMRIFDNGKYIRDESHYRSFFEDDFSVTIGMKFKKLFFYNELFFWAKRIKV